MAEATKKKKGVQFGGSDAKKDDPEAKLLKLLRFSPLRGRHGMQRHLKQYKELIYNLSSKQENDEEASNTQRNINLKQFIEIFDGKVGKDLCSKIFEMIYDGLDINQDNDKNDKDDNKDENDKDENNECISQYDIIKFMDGKKVARHVRTITEKDADWVLQHLKDVQFADLDKDGDGKIVIKDFYDHFEPLGVGKERIALMFQMLDKNDDKKISIFEYESWRRKQTASDLQTILNVKLLIVFPIKNKPRFIDDFEPKYIATQV